MKTIGIACTSDTVAIVAMSGHRGNPTLVEHRRFPAVDPIEQGKGLSRIRTEVLNMVERQIPDAVKVRVAGSFSMGKGPPATRLYLEGVCLEVASSSQVLNVGTIAHATIGTLLGTAKQSTAIRNFVKSRFGAELKGDETMDAASAAWAALPSQQ